MDTNMVYGIIAVVVIAVLLIAGGIWMDRSRKKAINRSQDEAKAKADARLAAERAAAAKPAAAPQAAQDQEESERRKAETAPKVAPGAEAQEEAAPAQAPIEVAAAEEPAPEPSEEPAAPATEKPVGKVGRLRRLRERLSMSNNPFGKALFNILAKDHLSEDDWEEVEDTLLMADVGTEASEELVNKLRTDARVTGQSDPTQLRAALKSELLGLVGTDTDRRLEAEKPDALTPSVIIMVGVNGTGKTTTAGKLARLFVSEDKSVMMGAADTFRAAAADQLETWGAKVGVPVVRSGREGADPASVAFEASAKAKESGSDVLIIDTAGRLQNKANLMDELGKIRRVTEKNLPVEEVLLVLDATTGQNGMAQAKVFAQAIGITGVVLTKLDGSAKGGIVISVQKELGVPVKLVGVGEGPDDLAPFDPESFVEGILGE